jgi:iron complex transport system ATP-binding protein
MMVTRLLRDFAHNNDTLVVMISHDLNIAAKYSDEVIMLHGGGVYAIGDPCDVITSSNIQHVYGVRSTVIKSHGRPHIVLEDDEDFKAADLSETGGL